MLCEVELKPGEGVVVGAFKSDDGQTKFSFITPVRQESDSGGPECRARSLALQLDDASVERLGLGGLKDGGRLRLQQFSRVTPEMWSADWKQARTMVMSRPTVIVRPDVRYRISAGSDDGDTISGMVLQIAGGEGVLLRVRLENNGRRDPPL